MLWPIAIICPALCSPKDHRSNIISVAFVVVLLLISSVASLSLVAHLHLQNEEDLSKFELQSQEMSSKRG